MYARSETMESPFVHRYEFVIDRESKIVQHTGKAKLKQKCLHPTTRPIPPRTVQTIAQPLGTQIVLHHRPCPKRPTNRGKNIKETQQSHDTIVRCGNLDGRLDCVENDTNRSLVCCIVLYSQRKQHQQGLVQKKQMGTHSRERIRQVVDWLKRKNDWTYQGG